MGRLWTMPSMVSLVVVTMLVVGTGEASCFEFRGSPAVRERRERKREAQLQRELQSRRNSSEGGTNRKEKNSTKKRRKMEIIAIAGAQG